MRSTKVFISGCVSGLRPEESKRNFERGKRLLLQNTYDYVNPLEIVPEGTSDKEAMKILLPVLMNCDAILLLSDSKFSKGSYVEEKVAQYCGLQIFYEDDLI
jgi:hypothetical protein